MLCNTTIWVTRFADICEMEHGPWTMSCLVWKSELFVDEDRLTGRQCGDLQRLSKPSAWFKARFDLIKSTCPSFMRPKYFSLVIFEAYKAARRAVVEQSSEFVSSGHSLVHDLALCSVQMHGLVKSASLSASKPVPSLAAGLPHFAAGWARCWGRDVVSQISLDDWLSLILSSSRFEASF